MTKLAKIRDAFNGFLSPTSFKPVKSGLSGHEFCYTILRKPLLYACDSRGSFHLEEDDEPTRGISDIWLDDLDVETVILKPDRFVLSHFKAGTYSKVCDYVVLTKPKDSNASELYAFYLDLKTDIYTDDVDQQGLFDHTLAANWEFAWQMAGGFVALNSLMSLGRKLKLLDEYQFRSIYVDIAIVKNRDMSSRVASYQASIPDKKIVNTDRHYWMVKNNGDRISAKDLVALF